MPEIENQPEVLPQPKDLGCILQVNTSDLGGGAEKYSYGLMTAFRDRGYDSWMAVGTKRRDDANVVVLPNKEQRPPYQRFMWSLHDRLEGSNLPAKPKRLLTWLVRRWAEPLVAWRNYLGFDSYGFRGTKFLLKLTPKPPSIVHLHNLHGGYFDLRLLPTLSRQSAVFITLHDNWALTGYCSYTFGCDRYISGCGKCPELGAYRKVGFDGTGQSWQHKKAIYQNSKLYIATPSQWMMNMVDRSVLGAAAVERRVIPVGVDQSVYKPGDKNEDRRALGLPLDAMVLVFASNGGRTSRYKDFATLRSAFEILTGLLATDKPLILLALGETGPSEFFGSAEIRFVPFLKEPSQVARYYRAADIYVHSAREDNFPAVIIEAMSCGTPVVATAVGGIPEQIRGLQTLGPHDLNKIPREQATGVLVHPRDPDALALAIKALLEDKDLLAELGANAAADAALRFNAETQIAAYLTWYDEVLKAKRHG